MLEEAKIYVAGHRGMVGSAVVRALQARGCSNLVLRTQQELDLLNQPAVADFFEQERPQVVVLAAARVGGILANDQHKAEFLYENLTIQNHVIQQAYRTGVKKFCFLGSSCIYPRACPQPMKEEHLLTGPLEPTNEGYALAKIAGIKLVEYYHRQYGFPGISLMPCNLYGTNDNYDPNGSHVIPALIRKAVEAVEQGAATIPVWGTGSALREIMHVDDLAAAVVFMLEHYAEPGFINVGWGEAVSIRELAELVVKLAGFQGRLDWDTSKPDGMPKKCMDVSRMRALGFHPQIDLEEGLAKTFAEYRATLG